MRIAERKEDTRQMGIMSDTVDLVRIGAEETGIERWREANEEER